MSELFTIAGISDSQEPFLHPDALAAIASHRVFAGGERHRDIVSHLLPFASRWISISPPLQGVLKALGEEVSPVMVFTSGDPLFYGFGATLQKAFPRASFRFFPSFHSLQMLAHRCALPYHTMRYASLTGRNWGELDRLLIEGESMIGVLTDKRKTPAAIARRLLEYRYDGYRMIVGEALGGPQERVLFRTLQEAASEDVHPLNAVFLLADRTPERFFGLSEELFEGLEGRPNMITKMPVRLATLSRLNLANARNFWDIGFCTASVSIEARLRFASLEVTAFEKRPECDRLFEDNTRSFRAPGITKVMGDFLQQPHREFCNEDGTVDAVFIGGHGNRLAEIFSTIDPLVSPGGRVAINAVSAASLEWFHALAERYGYRADHDIEVVAGGHNPIVIAAVMKTTEKR